MGARQALNKLLRPLPKQDTKTLSADVFAKFCLLCAMWEGILHACCHPAYTMHPRLFSAFYRKKEKNPSPQYCAELEA